MLLIFMTIFSLISILALTGCIMVMTLFIILEMDIHSILKTILIIFLFSFCASFNIVTSLYILDCVAEKIEKQLDNKEK